MCREVKEEFLELECHLKFDFDVIKGSGTPYKYCVYGTNHADEYEFLHGAPAPQAWRDYIRNRCLRVNKKPENGKNYIILFLEIGVTLELTKHKNEGITVFIVWLNYIIGFNHVGVWA